jgi:hypothetical protein
VVAVVRRVHKPLLRVNMGPPIFSAAAKLALRTTVSNLSDKQKYRLIVKYHERHRVASDGESNRSPEALAREECELSKAMVSYIKKGRELKDPAKRAHFEDVFRKRVAAEPGSDDYRALWGDVQAVIYGNPDPWRKMYLVRRRLAIGRISRSTKNGLMRSGFLPDAWLSLSSIPTAEETGA